VAQNPHGSANTQAFGQGPKDFAYATGESLETIQGRAITDAEFCTTRLALEISDIFLVTWSVFQAVRARLAAGGLITLCGLFSQLAAPLAERHQPPFDYVVVDEAQDVGVAQLRFLAALAGERPNGLFFAGDLGQRIF
jgi:UvrD/REP helicase N-terminal domain